MTLEEAKALAIKVLSKTLDLTKLTSEKGNCSVIKSKSPALTLCRSKINMVRLSTVEMATLTRKDDKTIITILPAAQVDELVAAYEKLEAEAEAAKREKQKS